ncbi:ParB/RepB/Spo0J family partition protein [Ruminococcaceae bacterium OttesenSCG-928-L11]|nr:ParB/RepB/Spo0J family partition protein [Ruminococcaceae bacterium OttesenSCG-928-L11]
MPRKTHKGGNSEAGGTQLTFDFYGGERITEMPLTELHTPDPHPFLVADDEAMSLLVDSIKQYGVREPGLARPLENGGYELLCGNRRKHACELAGLQTMPVIIREMDDETAIIAMVDSNLQQREKLLYSEMAWAYRMKLEALNHSGIKAEQNSIDILIEQTGKSKNQIFRLVRLTELVNDLLDMVDTRQLAFNAGVELSYLSYDDQFVVVDAMKKHEIKPSLSQAGRLKKLAKDGKLTPILIDSILSEPKKSPVSERTARLKYRRYFPPDYSQKQVESVIVSLLKDWQKSQQNIML